MQDRRRKERVSKVLWGGMKMSKAFSCIVGRNRNVYWKTGMDSHEDLRAEFGIKDDNKTTPIEITPDNKDYIEEEEVKKAIDIALKEQAEQFHDYLIEKNLPVHKDFFKRFKPPRK